MRGLCIEVTKDQDVAVIEWQSSQTSHAAVGASLIAIRESFDNFPVLPGDTAINTPRLASTTASRPFGPVHARVVIDPSVGKLDQRGFTRSLLGEWLAGLPALTTVVAVDGVGILPGPVLFAIFRSVVSRGAKQAPLVGTAH